MTSVANPSSLTVLVLCATLVTLLAVPAFGLRCYQCGEYVDDVGSITPCNTGLTEKHLQMCQPNVGDACVKYVSPGIEAYGCSGHCLEKRATEGSVYCCRDEGCNSSGAILPSLALFAVALTSAIVCKHL